MTLASPSSQGSGLSWFLEGYGVSMRGPFRLWAGRPATPTDVPDIEVIRLPEPLAPIAPASLSLSGDDDYVAVPGQIAIRIHKGRLIETAVQCSDEVACAYVRGIGLAAALHQRGGLVVHGSAVTGPRGAILFVGDSGAGKSTIAASLRARGWELVSDGMTAVRVSPTGVHASHGPPEVRLWPDALVALGQPVDNLPLAFPGIEKRLMPVDGRTASTPENVRAIYLLERSAGADNLLPERLAPAAAAVGLLRHLVLSPHCTREGATVLLRLAADLAARVPVYALKRGNSLEALPELLDSVEHDGD